MHRDEVQDQRGERSRLRKSVRYRLAVLGLALGSSSAELPNVERRGKMAKIKRESRAEATANPKEHNNYITGTDEAQVLFSLIPDGSAEPLYVPNGNTMFRKLVAEANRAGDCIINIEGGYYRPIPTEDDAEVQHYFARELHRARAILYKREQMKKAYEARKEMWADVQM